MPPAHSQHPSWLVFRIPTWFRLQQEFKLTENISLLPGARHEQQPGSDAHAFQSTILYVERNPPAEELGPPPFPSVVSFRNLREFIHFWSFITQETEAILAFERGKGPVVMDTPPNETPTYWENNPRPLDPLRFQVGDRHLALDSAFDRFKASGNDRDLAALLLHRPNRHVVDRWRVAYDNYLLDAALVWFVIDALLPPKRCGTTVDCPKCKKKGVQLSHPVESFKTRAETAFNGFPEPKELVELLDKLRKARGNFVHEGSSDEIPPTQYPEADPDTGNRRREVGLKEAADTFGVEGLATKHGLHTAHHVAYWLLFNRIFPDLNVWPSAGKMFQVTTGLASHLCIPAGSKA